MKSIYLISRARISGPVNQALNIINGLNESKLSSVSLVTLSPELPNNSWLSRFYDAKIEHHCLNAGVFQIFSAIRQLRKYINENEIDVIHSSGFRANMIASFMSHRFRKVSTQRCSPDDIGEKFPNYLRKLITAIYLKIIKRLDCNVACSKSLQDIFKKDYNLPVECVPNCVNTDFFVPVSKEEKMKLREELKFDKDRKVFLILGSLRARKDNITAISVFNQLIDEKIQLAIVGDGPEMELLKSQITNPNILIPGGTPDPIKYLQASDILISCSLAEGLPNTVLEAISCGLPCILSDIGPHREIIENSSAGVLFPTKDVDALKRSVLEAISWGDDRYIVARELAVNEFGIPTLARRYSKIYHKQF